MATMTVSRVDELMRAEEGAAWREYLAATCDQSSLRYEEVEPWAWTRLQNRLAKVAQRRSLLKRPARHVDEDDDGA